MLEAALVHARLPALVRRFMPVIPMVLVNGAEGIGTGWSTFIPNYNPADICANTRALLAGQPLTPMQVSTSLALDICMV